MYKSNSEYQRTIVAENCQFYVKIYLSERINRSLSTSTVTQGLVTSTALNNCFFVFDVKSVTSTTPLVLFYNCNCFNTYFALRDSAEHDIRASLKFNTDSSSSPNNWYIFENKDTNKIELVDASSSKRFEEITEEANAKDAAWLVDNLGFIVKV